MRGEYIMAFSQGEFAKELPPRARRIRGDGFVHGYLQGTTSACAENTQRFYLVISAHGNYLRVRGEYVDGEESPLGRTELPPRARRIP